MAKDRVQTGNSHTAAVALNQRSSGERLGLNVSETVQAPLEGMAGSRGDDLRRSANACFAPQVLPMSLYCMEGAIGTTGLLQALV